MPRPLRRHPYPLAVVLAVTSAASSSQEAINYAGPNMLAVASAAAMNDVYRDAFGKPGWRSEPERPMSAAARRVLDSTNRVTSRDQARSGPSLAPRAVPTNKAGTAHPLTYAVTPQLAQQTVDAMVKRLQQADPKAAEALAGQFARHDYDGIYRGIVAPFGYNDADAADALAAYTLLGWLIATGAGDPAPLEAQAVRAQLAPRLAANPQLAQSATRGSLAEELKLLFVTLHAGWQSARREGNLQRYSDGVAAMFAKQGTDLRALRLTEQGFVAR